KEILVNPKAEDNNATHTHMEFTYTLMIQGFTATWHTLQHGTRPAARHTGVHPHPGGDTGPDYPKLFACNPSATLSV
ncbi:hypothetical protein, partial [Corynebacterium sp. HMSC29G08]|uniref:hypothetical protein n=1 Tax=Corynebacterium sp. HMSC29G08 TaxID=1581069 RepID=UPI001AEF3FDF